MAINYGSDKVRFLQPVRAGSRIRAHQEYLEITERRRGQFLVRCEVSVEIEGEGKPALIAETLALFIAADPRQE
jgi:acyl dehydratase